MEKRVTFDSAGFRIEGLFREADGRRGVVITHPHPHYGGDMDNPVVAAVGRAYAGMGFSTLRFNFRGTGASEGRYDEGRGERLDVAAALDFLAARGMTAVDLAGYSFGAWVNARVPGGFRRMLMVSPPVAFMDFGAPESIKGLGLIVSGSRDDIAPPGMIAGFARGWSPSARLVVLEGADHFYGGHLSELEETVATWLKEQPAFPGP
jgi:alpha/beta superfamily hydrolase